MDTASPRTEPTGTPAEPPVAAPCPACGCPRTTPTFSATDVPTHSCVLLPDAGAARAFPRGDIELVVCESCGYGFNSAFDAARVDYSRDYEETQAHSPTFQTWLTSVVDHLVDDLGVRGKTVLEIGCGRGDFLELLCARGGNRGIGIDPSGTAGRVDHTVGGGITLLREPYGASHMHYAADVVVCRHTLEHLSDPAQLLGTLRAHLTGCPETLVFFEVPDFARILAESAFWDMYYEHCAYFGARALGHLFRSCGFDVLSIERAYGDQYLQLLARPAVEAACSATTTAESDDTISPESIATFRTTCTAARTQWRALMESARARGETTALWGAGSKATGFLSAVGAESIVAVVDVNPVKHGTFVAGCGAPVVAPHELQRLRPDHVFVMNPIYAGEIAHMLTELAVVTNIVLVGDAPQQARVDGQPATSA